MTLESNLTVRLANAGTATAPAASTDTAMTASRPSGSRLTLHISLSRKSGGFEGLGSIKKEPRGRDPRVTVGKDAVGGPLDWDAAALSDRLPLDLDQHPLTARREALGLVVKLITSEAPHVRNPPADTIVPGVDVGSIRHFRRVVEFAVRVIVGQHRFDVTTV
jgi:hypothetical protein